MTDFQKSIIEGIPDVLPAPKPFDPTVNHAPHRKQILTAEEKKLALRNALRYFHLSSRKSLRLTDVSICTVCGPITRYTPAV